MERISAEDLPDEDFQGKLTHVAELHSIEPTEQTWLTVAGECDCGEQLASMRLLPIALSGLAAVAAIVAGSIIEIPLISDVGFTALCIILIVWLYTADRPQQVHDFLTQGDSR